MTWHTAAVSILLASGFPPLNWQQIMRFEEDGFVQDTYLARPLNIRSPEVRDAARAFCRLHAQRPFAKLFVSDNIVLLEDSIYGQGFFGDDETFVMRSKQKGSHRGTWLDVIASRGGCKIRSRQVGSEIEEEVIGPQDPTQAEGRSDSARLIWLRLMTIPVPFHYDRQGLYAAIKLPVLPHLEDAQRIVANLAKRFGVAEVSLQIRGDFLFSGLNFPGPQVYQDNLETLSLDRYLAGWEVGCEYRKGKPFCIRHR